MPIRNGYADEIYIITSGEMMSMYAATNISHAVDQFKDRGYAKLKGLILNAKGVENEELLVSDIAAEIGTEVVHYIPRNQIVQDSENRGMTSVEAFTKNSVKDEGEIKMDKYDLNSKKNYVI